MTASHGGGIVQTVQAVTRLTDAGIRQSSYRETAVIDLTNPRGELVLSIFGFLTYQESSVKTAG